jgi:hypothetical protein
VRRASKHDDRKYGEYAEHKRAFQESEGAHVSGRVGLGLSDIPAE